MKSLCAGGTFSCEERVEKTFPLVWDLERGVKSAISYSLPLIGFSNRFMDGKRITKISMKSKGHKVSDIIKVSTVKWALMRNASTIAD